MKIKLYAFIIIILSFFTTLSFGQPVGDRVETNCEGLSRSIYEEIGANKVIFIIATATNCGSCMSEASDVASFATHQKDQISVWGAMNNLFGNADCPSVKSWGIEYGWEDVFTFPDNDNYWVSGGFSNFTIINPHDSSIAYNGLDFQFAKDTAEALSQLVALNDIESPFTIQDAYPNPFQNDITIKFMASSSQIMKVRLFDITGQQIFMQQYEVKPYMKKIKLDLVDYAVQQGVYLLRIEQGSEVSTIRMVKD